MAGTYSEQQRIKYTQKLNDIMDMLPDFTRDYFFSLEYTKQPRTKVAYAMDLRGFFEFIRAVSYTHLTLPTSDLV